ncbi:endonuclease/exonuclease/phosphatase family protein [Kineococcus gynurae]|uniref:Endonuclease/exonuclease/phosphatase family protein n=1 Tax=Kineococcus gynurae TaxID=452979 RepID=A0ABV5LUG9_9ACTN
MGGTSAAGGTVALRLASANVRECADDRAALRRVLAATGADVLCLQEVPTRIWTRHRATALARDLGLRTVALGRAGAGTAVLATDRVDVVAGAVRALPTPFWRGRRPVRRRGVAEVEVRVPGDDGAWAAVRVGSIHLGLDEAERHDHATRVCTTPPPGAGSAAGTPEILAGDLNEADGPARRYLCERLSDAAEQVGSTFPTFPARAPRRRIDAVLVDRRVTVERVWTPDVGADAVAATDHLVLVADLRVPLG